MMQHVFWLGLLQTEFPPNQTVSARISPKSTRMLTVETMTPKKGKIISQPDQWNMNDSNYDRKLNTKTFCMHNDKGCWHSHTCFSQATDSPSVKTLPSTPFRMTLKHIGISE